MTTNGHDRGLRGVPFRLDHTAEETRARRSGCACLVALAAGVIVAALVCGAVGAVWLWR